MKFYRLFHSPPEMYDDEAARRGEDPPTLFDGVLRFLAAIFHGVCAILCFIGMALFAMDATSAGKSLSIIVCGVMGAGFGFFAAVAFRRGVQIFLGKKPAPRGFEIESGRDEP